MNSDHFTRTSDPDALDPLRIGAGWGALFALPALAFALFVLLDERHAYLQYIARAALLLCGPLLLILAGIWWATHRRVWHLLLGAAAVGLALLAFLFAVLTVEAWSSGRQLPVPGAVQPVLVAWAIFATWALALAVVVAWHVRRALRRASAEGGSVPSHVGQTITPQRFAFQLALAVAAPMLASVPIILLLRYDIGLRNPANALLLQEIRKITAQIGDIADYEKVRAGYLSRKQILDVVEPVPAQAADVLHVLGAMPDGLQLALLETKGNRVRFTFRAESAASERTLVDLLQHNGFRDVRADPRASAREPATVTATSTRGDTE